MAIIRTSTATMSRERWLLERKKGIGGSDAAAVVGLTEYSSPYALWCEKTGRALEKEETEAMRQGRDLEDYVAQRFAQETGKRVRRNRAILINTDYPFALANVDRLVMGEEAGLECKTTSVLSLKKFAGGEFPARYYCQCMHYLAVTGLRRWYLAVLVLGREFLIYTVERDEAEIEALMGAERDFWALVQSDTPPAMSGTEADSRALEGVYPAELAGGSESEPVEVFGREAMLERYMELKGELAELERQKKAIEQTIQADLGERERGYCRDYDLRWEKRGQLTVDTKRFFAEHPELDPTPYTKETLYRQFSCRRMKEA